MLCRADSPMTAREIATQLAARYQMDASNMDVMNALVAKVRNTLARQKWLASEVRGDAKAPRIEACRRAVEKKVWIGRGVRWKFTLAKMGRAERGDRLRPANTLSVLGGCFQGWPIDIGNQPFPIPSETTYTQKYRAWSAVRRAPAAASADRNRPCIAASG
jgi:hypothetical protein